MWLRLSRRVIMFLIGNKLLRRVMMEQARKVAAARAMRYARDNLRRDEGERFERGEDYVEIPVRVE